MPPIPITTRRQPNIAEPTQEEILLEAADSKIRVRRRLERLIRNCKEMGETAQPICRHEQQGRAEGARLVLSGTDQGG
jgi:hypothetical protein